LRRKEKKGKILVPYKMTEQLRAKFNEVTTPHAQKLQILTLYPSAIQRVERELGETNHMVKRSRKPKVHSYGILGVIEKGKNHSDETMQKIQISKVIESAEIFHERTT